MKKKMGHYRVEEPISISNEKLFYPNYLRTLIDIFNDGYSWAQCVKRHLLAPESKGVTGNWIDIQIQNDIISIEPTPLTVNDPEEYKIEIDRRALIEIITKWEKLADKDCVRITFTRYEDGTIDVTDGAVTTQ